MKNFRPDTVIVYAWLDGQYVPAGKLRMSGGLSEFWYGEQFLQNGYALDPLRLPLTAQVFSASGLQGNLGALGDALPDSWGRYVLKCRYERVLSELDILTTDTSTQRMGALFFSNDLDDAPSAQSHSVDWMMQFSNWVNDNSAAFPEFIEYGSSAGGAKPKCLVNIDNAEWIAKFQPGSEPLDTPAIEHGTLRLAQSCGIPVPDSRLLALPNGQHAVLIKRFDRLLEEPLHYLSGHTLCGVLINDRGQVINDTRSYLVLADALSQFSSQPVADRLDLFRRIVFNILVNNHDDHVKNHGVIRMLNGQWQLSPAFDLVAGEGTRRNLAMTIGPQGSQATLSNLMQSLASFGLDKSTALNEITQMVLSLKKWKVIFADAGVKSSTINEIVWAIQENIDVSGL